MTNEEKAKEICCSDCVFVNKGLKWCTPCTGAKVGIPKMVEMAKWKDKEFEYIINIALEMIGEQNGSCSEDVFAYQQKIKDLLRNSNNQ